jgi:hypothetical protein
MFEKIAVTLVRLLSGTESAELTHRPELASIHRFVDPTRVRRFTRISEIAGFVEFGDTLRRIDLFDRHTRYGREHAVSQILSHEVIIGAKADNLPRV